MSMKEYNEAKKIIEENEDMIDAFEGASDVLISKAECALGVMFPSDFKKYLSDYGALDFGSSELYGLFREDFENSGVPDAVWATLHERKLISMPDYLVVVYNSDRGELYCLNYNKLNKENTPVITSYYPGFDEEVQEHEELYNNFGEFILDMVTEELKE